MIGIKRTLIIMVCSACLYGQITGSVSNVGTTAASFLDIGIGARSLSMQPGNGLKKVVLRYIRK
jgi:hypothetical protein